MREEARMSRQERRKQQLAEKKTAKRLAKKDLVHPVGGPLERAEIIPKTSAQLEAMAKRMCEEMPDMTWELAMQSLLEAEKDQEVYINDVYQVLVYRGVNADEMIHQPNLKGKCVWLSIKRRDKTPCTSWQDFQTIKNRLIGTRHDAIQIYPSEERMVNTSNQYHMIVFPTHYTIPFGWMSRAVSTEDKGHSEQEELNRESKQNFKGEII